MASRSIAPALPAEVEDAEDRYNNLAAYAEECSYNWGTGRRFSWGDREQTELAELADDLRHLYRKHNIDPDDQIAGIN